MIAKRVDLCLPNVNIRSASGYRRYNVYDFLEILMSVTSTDHAHAPSVCFVGPRNLPLLDPSRETPSSIGGAERQQTLLALELAKQGVDVSMIVYGEHNNTVPNSFEGIKIVPMCTHDKRWPLLGGFYAQAWSLWGVMKSVNADVYHITCASSMSAVMALFAKMYNKRSVFRMASNSDSVKETMIVSGLRDTFLATWGIENSSLVISQNMLQKTNLQRNFKVNSVILKSLLAYSSEAQLAEKDIDVLWVSNIRDLKRPQLALDLAKDQSFSVHLVGGPVSNQEAMYDDILKQAGSMDNVHCEGYLSADEVEHCFNRSKVFINTSYVEGFPNTYLQAWSKGIPVVTYLDIDDMVSEHELGYVVTTPDEMLQKVRLLLEDDDARRVIGERCKAFISEHFSNADVAKKFMSLV